MTRPRLAASIAALTAGVLLTGSVSGCSMLSKDKGASTTCSQFASMDSETGLLGSPNDDQTTTIKSMLSAHDKATNDSNVRVAYLKFIQYCNIYGGQSGSNEDKTIDNISGLD